MRRDQKPAVVEQLSERFRAASIAVVSEYRGMTVEETTDVRRKLRAARGEFKVAKNTLIRRAIKDTSFAELDSQLGGTVALIFGTDDPVELAKTVASFKSLGEKFKVRGGVLDGKPITAEEIEALATLPPREVVLGQLLGLINAPATRLVRLLNEPAAGLARLVDAIGKKTGEAAAA